MRTQNKGSKNAAESSGDPAEVQEKSGRKTSDIFYKLYTN